MACLCVRAIANLNEANISLVAATSPVVNTLWLSPRVLVAVAQSKELVSLKPQEGLGALLDHCLLGRRSRTLDHFLY